MTDPTETNHIRVRVEETEQQRIRIDETAFADDAPLHVEMEENHTYNALIHISALLAVWAGGLAFLGPLILWLLFRNDHPAVEPHAKEALNFQITLFIQVAIGGLLAFFAFLIPFVGWIMLVPLIIYLVVLGLMGFIAPIIAAIDASNGRLYRYPLTWRILK